MGLNKLRVHGIYAGFIYHVKQLVNPYVATCMYMCIELNHNRQKFDHNGRSHKKEEAILAKWFGLNPQTHAMLIISCGIIIIF